MNRQRFIFLGAISAVIAIAIFAYWGLQGAAFVTQYEVSYEVPIEDEFEDAFGDEDPFADDDPFADQESDDPLADDGDADSEDSPQSDGDADTDESIPLEAKAVDDDYEGPTQTVWKEEFRFGLMPDRGYDGAITLGGGFALLALIFFFVAWRKGKNP